MKSFSLIFLPVIAASVFSVRDPAVLKRYSSSAPVGPSYLIEENCEGTGTPSGWTDNATPDWDYTTTVLNGSQSFAVSSSTMRSEKSFTASGEVWAAVWYRVSSIANNPYSIRLYDGSANLVAHARFLSGGEINAGNGTLTTSSAAATIAANTTYQVILRYVKGTGANGITTVEVYDTGGSLVGSASRTTGNATADASVLRISTGVNSATGIFDLIRADDVEIDANYP